MNIADKIAAELHIQPWQVEAVICLIDEGNTIPFIARYRKEMHGELNDEQIRNLSERLSYLRNLEERKTAVLPPESGGTQDGSPVLHRGTGEDDEGAVQGN